MRINQHLHADKGQHHGQTSLEVAEIINRPGQHKVERTKTQNGKDVRSEDNEAIGRDAEDGGNGIHGENQVGGFHAKQHQRKRCQRAATVDGGEKFLPLQRGGHGIKFPHQPQDEILFRMHLSVAAKDHLHAREENERAHEIENPLKPMDHRHAHANQQPAHDQRAQDAPEQNAVLELQWHAEVSEDKRDDKHVVH